MEVLRRLHAEGAERKKIKKSRNSGKILQRGVVRVKCMPLPLGMPSSSLASYARGERTSDKETFLANHF